MSTTRSTFTTALVAIGLISSLAGAQSYSYTPGAYSAPPVPVTSAAAAPTLNADQLRQLVGPIALYPDPLLTQVLAAATYPQDIAAAQQWLQYFPNPSEDDINGQPWDPSVKAIVHYPTVLAMMAGQPDWTAALGAAFANQPQDVMNTVQQLRAEAQAANALVSTAQQQVVTADGAIQIIPAQPNVIYVPQYDPAVVYVQQPYYGSSPLITFGPAFGVGVWLNLGWDWHLHHVDQGVRWDHGWGHPDFGHVSEWRHNPQRPIVVPHDYGHDFHGDNRGPGWDHAPARPPAFDDRGHVDDRNHAPERPVQGIPNHAAPPHVEPNHPAPPHPAPQPRPVEVPHPVAPPHAPAPPPHVNERPVEGISHPAPAPEPAPHAPALGSMKEGVRQSPPSAFHSEGGGGNVQSGRGNGSMHR